VIDVETDLLGLLPRPANAGALGAGIRRANPRSCPPRPARPAS